MAVTGRLLHISECTCCTAMAVTRFHSIAQIFSTAMSMMGFHSIAQMFSTAMSMTGFHSVCCPTVSFSSAGDLSVAQMKSQLWERFA